MTIDEKLGSLFDASPAPVAALGNRVYGQTAPRNVVKPYGVYSLVSRLPFHNQEDNPGPLKRWYYQLAIYGLDRLQNIRIRNAALVFLVGYSDPAGTPGIRRIAEINVLERHEDKERLNVQLLEIDIMEDLTD